MSFLQLSKIIILGDDINSLEMENTLEIEKTKENLYKKVDHLFNEVPPYQDLVEALTKECQERGYTQQATKETIMEYFLLWKPI